jgi:hypothetical protein
MPTQYCVCVLLLFHSEKKWLSTANCSVSECLHKGGQRGGLKPASALPPPPAAL